ncbi:MAG: hypothetical protein HZB55_09925 [Deltaproteobacteria bacterium]|nr:hypothetical protein [Deltaproteobacteria bacterium]
MGGEAPDNTQLAPDPDAAAAARRKLAVVKLVLAVPGFFLGALTLAIAYRMTGRRLGDAVFWLALAPILAGFAALAGHALWQLRRNRVR